MMTLMLETTPPNSLSAQESRHLLVSFIFYESFAHTQWLFKPSAQFLLLQKYAILSVIQRSLIIPFSLWQQFLVVMEGLVYSIKHIKQQIPGEGFCQRYTSSTTTLGIFSTYNKAIEHDSVLKFLALGGGLTYSFSLQGVYRSSWLGIIRLQVVSIFLPAHEFGDHQMQQWLAQDTRYRIQWQRYNRYFGGYDHSKHISKNCIQSMCVVFKISVY